MNLSVHGNNTSHPEITHISAHGVWLLAHDHEFFMAYSEFPWFQEQSVNAILNVEELSPDHFYWPDLDVDLTRDMIEHPERFPKIFRN